MNQLLASAYDASKGFYLPASRITNDLSLEALSAIGITVDGELTAEGFRHCTMPAGWTPVPTDVSPMQLRWQDAQGRLRAKVFYKPGSQGGRGSMEICCRFNVYLRTNDTLQWAEVFDGNVMIHHTATGTKTVDKMGFTERQQPQFAEAQAWLTKTWPDNANPLAYWI
jgi:hypothetical protein